MISAGQLRSKIDFLESSTTRSETGAQVTAWNTVYTCRAKVDFLKGSRAIQLSEVWNPTSIVVLCRKSIMINFRERIKWNGNTYMITSINTDESDQSMTINCDLKNE